MKICLINNLYGEFSRGGAERIVKLSAEGFIARGHAVTVITTRPYFRHPAAADGAIRIRYLKSFYHYLGRMPKASRFFPHFLGFINIAGYFGLKAVIRSEKPDLVITHNLMGIGFYAPLVISALRVKHIHTLHDIQLLHPSGLMLYGKEKITDSPVAKIYQFIQRKLFGNVPVIVSPSRWLLGEHEKRGFFARAEKLVIPNPVSAVKSAVAGTSAKEGGAIFRLLYAGQIEEHKGILFFLRACGRLAKETPAIKVSVAGDGSKLKKARAMAGENGNIRFFGRIGGDEVAKLMAASDCLVCPSLCYENSPAVIYEAISAGLPVLAARLGGITELVRAGGGILFEPGDEYDFIEKLRWIMGHYEDIAAKAARQRDGSIESGGADYADHLIAIARQP